MIGDRYGRLTVIGKPFSVSRFSGEKKRRDVMCVCQCDCGSVVAYKIHNLGECSVCSFDCGCKRRKRPGPTGRPLYNTWNSIRYRCFNPKCPAYPDYGGRGIGMCLVWAESFEVFEAWSMMNGWRPGLEIDRIDNDGDYEPDNCRYTSKQLNCRNRRSTRLLTGFGETKCAAAWATDPRLQVHPSTLFKRLAKGIPLEAAVTRSEQCSRG